MIVLNPIASHRSLLSLSAEEGCQPAQEGVGLAEVKRDSVRKRALYVSTKRKMRARDRTVREKRKL